MSNSVRISAPVGHASRQPALRAVLADVGHEHPAAHVRDGLRDVDPLARGKRGQGAADAMGDAGPIARGQRRQPAGVAAGERGLRVAAEVLLPARAAR